MAGIVRIDVVTIFPDTVRTALDFSIMQRAQATGVVEFGVHNPRDYAADRHKMVDDAPYGGGAGMVMKPEPLVACVEGLIAGETGVPVVLMTPQGAPFTHQEAARLARSEHLVIVCGHYEGVDERVRQTVITDEISVGDYVLTGGELPALIVIDAVVRLLPGAVGNELSPECDSFSDGLLEHPHYTRPPEFRGLHVPAALARGHHEQVRRWRRQMSLLRTYRRRPDLLARAELSDEDRELLAEALGAVHHDRNRQATG